MHTTRVLALTAAGALAIALTGCASTASPTATATTSTTELTALLPQSIQDSGVLRLGNSAPYPPFSIINDDSTHTGLDIELGDALGAALGVQVEWSFQQWDQLQTSLDADRFDAIISGSSDRTDDHDTVWFVDYLHNGPALIMPAEAADEAGITTQTDLCGMRISREFNSTQFDEYLDAFNQESCIDAGLESMVMVDASESAVNFTNIQSGRADAALEPAVNAGYRAQVLEPDTWAVIGGPIHDTMNAIQVPREDTELRDALVAAFAQLLEDGTYAAIAEGYGLGDLVPTQPYVNLEPVS